MIRKILWFTVFTLVSAYLLIAVTAFNRIPAGEVCRDMVLIIKDSVYTGFITKEEIVSILEKKEMYPVGRTLASIHTRAIEELLSKHSLINKVECYKTPSGKLCIEVSQRIPILRIMSAGGGNYYIDDRGEEMPLDSKCVAHLPIVTGKVEKSFAMRDLYKFGVFLQQDKFWNAQIEQINVLPNSTVELIPRVGNHIVYLGRLTGFEEKLERVKIFYRKGLNRVGWNKYSRINVEFDNQIICTKRE